MNKYRDIDEKHVNLFKQIETLYIEGRYQDVIDLKSKYPAIDHHSISQDQFFQLIEIYAGSYIQLNMFSEAIELIDSHIQQLKDRKPFDVEIMDDLTTFYHFKIIIYQKKKALLSEYKTINEYIALGGTDINLLNLKKDVEHLIYDRYIILNKVVYGIAIILIVLSISFPMIFRNTLTSLGTTIVIVWMVINYIYHKRIEELFLKVLNYF